MSEITVAELKQICKKKNIKGYSKLKKIDLLKLCLGQKLEMIFKSKSSDNKQILNDMTKESLYDKILRHERKENKSSGIKLNMTKNIMIDYIEKNIPERKQRVRFDPKINIKKIKITKKSFEGRKTLLSVIAEEKQKIRTISKFMYKNIPTQEEYVSIKLDNIKKRRLKKEPLKFIKSYDQNKNKNNIYPLHKVKYEDEEIEVKYIIKKIKDNTLKASVKYNGTSSEMKYPFDPDDETSIIIAEYKAKIYILKRLRTFLQQKIEALN
jgi:hypothetical protein